MLGGPGEDAALVFLVPPGALVFLAGGQFLEAVLIGMTTPEVIRDEVFSAFPVTDLPLESCGGRTATEERNG